MVEACCTSRLLLCNLVQITPFNQLQYKDRWGQDTMGGRGEEDGNFPHFSLAKIPRISARFRALPLPPLPSSPSPRPGTSQLKLFLGLLLSPPLSSSHSPSPLTLTFNFSNKNTSLHVCKVPGIDLFLFCRFRLTLSLRLLTTFFNL